MTAHRVHRPADARWPSLGTNVAHQPEEVVLGVAKEGDPELVIGHLGGELGWAFFTGAAANDRGVGCGEISHREARYSALGEAYLGAPLGRRERRLYEKAGKPESRGGGADGGGLDARGRDDAVGGVNTTLVSRLVWGLGLWLVAGAAIAHAAASKSAPVPLGDGTYRITREADTVFARATTPLRYEAEGDAAKFCAEHGKRLKVVSVDEEKASLVRGGFSRVTLVFKALSPGDPELAGEPYRGEPVANETSSEQAARYQRMLDELHAARVLSDQEFKAAKKRVEKRGK